MPLLYSLYYYASIVITSLKKKKHRESLNNSILTQIISLEKAKIPIFTRFENGLFRLGILYN